MDFRDATSHFTNPDFDGDPVQIYEPGEDDPITPPDDIPPRDEDPIPPEPGENETIIDAPPTFPCHPMGQGGARSMSTGWAQPSSRKGWNT